MNISTKEQAEAAGLELINLQQQLDYHHAAIEAIKRAGTAIESALFRYCTADMDKMAPSEYTNPKIIAPTPCETLKTA